MKAILKSINNFSCKIKQKVSNNKLKTISDNESVVIEDAIVKSAKDYKIYGNTYQETIEGRNLYNYNDTVVVSDGIVKDNDGWVTVTYDNPSETNVKNLNYFTNNLNIKPDTNYNIIVEIKEATGNGTLYFTSTYTNPSGNEFGQFNTKSYNFNNSTDGIVYQNIMKSKQDFTDIEYGLRTVIQINPGQNVSITFRISVLEDLTITPSTFVYEPYTAGQPSPSPEYPQEIVSCGDRTKNLCVELQQGGYDVNTGEKTSITTFYRNKEPIKVLTNTNYIFSINGIGQAINVLAYKSDGTYIGRIGTSTIPANSYFTTSSETAYINIFRGISAGIEEWQIEQNDTVTSYEPYEKYKIPINVNGNITNIYLDEPLRKIGDYSDYIDFKSGKVVRNINKVILDGSENWTTNNKSYRLNNVINGKPFSNIKDVRAICNSFIWQNGAASTFVYGSFWYTYDGKNLAFQKDRVLNVAEFKTWLSEHPVPVYYVLATPTEEDIELPELHLIEGKNTITIGTELESIIEVEYYSKEIVDISNYKYNLRKVED